MKNLLQVYELIPGQKENAKALTLYVYCPIKLIQLLMLCTFFYCLFILSPSTNKIYSFIHSPFGLQYVMYETGRKRDLYINLCLC